ncbi:MAG: sterol desaturase family protein [Ideonella sp.]|nr:sterol desaturase family protein [Ideonella sp.]MCC7458833.1 sterol desaturase family protein [Nitrospira sp.]
MTNAELAEAVPLLVPLTYFFCLATEARWPARRFPPRRGWRWLGVGFFVLLAAVGSAVPLLLPLQWLAAHRWLDGTALGVAGGTLVGWLVLSFVAFAYHRTAHAWSPLWRMSHQLHHSPQRVDVSGAALFHPFEMVVQVLLQLFVTVIVLGLEPLAAALVGVIAAFAGIYQHWNVRTPRWTGWFIQRPEAHCLHHERGVHGRNYADFPPWDMLFGSFANPRDFDGACGFDAPADRQLGAMLAWHDVNEPLLGSGSRGAAGQPV